MKTEINIMCTVTEDKSFDFIVTSYEGTANEMCLHGINLDASIRFSPEQGQHLINEIQKGIIRIEVYNKVQERSL